jgi:hypothetical protein
MDKSKRMKKSCGVIETSQRRGLQGDYSKTAFTKENKR